MASHIVSFTDPSDSFKHQTIQEGMLKMIRDSRDKIIIHSYNMMALRQISEFDEVLANALSKGASLYVYAMEMIDARAIQSAFARIGSGVKECYYWTPPEGKEDSLYHIKAITVDDSQIYVGSANMSNRAVGTDKWDDNTKNAEWGVFFRDHSVALELDDFARHLVSKGYFTPVR